MKTMQRWLWGAVLAAAGGSAVAARPLLTDDAEPLAPGRCEIEGEGARARADGVTEHAQGLDFGCGVFDGTQLGIGGAWVRGPEGRARALGLGFKSRLWAGAGDAAPALSLAGALGWLREPGGGWRHEADELTLIATLPAEGWAAHLNLGHWRDRGAGRRSTRWGLAAEGDPWPAAGLGWAPMAEVFGDDRGERWALAGLRVTVLPERLFVDLSYSRTLAGPACRAWAAGFKLAF